MVQTSARIRYMGAMSLPTEESVREMSRQLEERESGAAARDERDEMEMERPLRPYQDVQKALLKVNLPEVALQIYENFSSTSYRYTNAERSTVDITCLSVITKLSQSRPLHLTYFLLSTPTCLNLLSRCVNGTVTGASADELASLMGSAAKLRRILNKCMDDVKVISDVILLLTTYLCVDEVENDLNALVREHEEESVGDILMSLMRACLSEVNTRDILSIDHKGGVLFYRCLLLSLQWFNFPCSFKYFVMEHRIIGIELE
ncbi:unnamed protein product [Sphagnum tenellum]